MADPTRCPLFPSYPTDTQAIAFANTFYGDLALLLPLGSTQGAWKCASKKFGAASVRLVNRLKCHEKALKVTPRSIRCA